MSPWRFSLLGYQVGFAQPLLLLTCLFAGLVAAGTIYLALQRRQQLGRVIAPRFFDKLAPGVSRVRPALRAGLGSLALLSFGFCLGQPQCGSRSELTKRRGIDVVVALDASKSMLARDVAPSRLERAKLELNTLLDELKGDRVGLVIFAGEAFIQCPLTSDYAAAKMFLRAVDPEQMPQGGTHIGAALTLSKKVLDEADRGSKDRVVVLLSDGEDLAGDLAEGADALKEAGVKIYAVGIGSEQGEPIPLISRKGEVAGFQKDAEGNTVLSKLDRAGLTQLAEATGGEYFHQPRGVAMGEVVSRIDQLQKSELESRRVVRYAEGYQPFLAVGLAAFTGSLLVRPSRRRRP